MKALNPFKTLFAFLAVASIAIVASVQPGQARDATQVYLLRGFLNVFSLGMDSLAEKIEKRGIHAEVFNHMSYGGVVAEAKEQYRKGNHGPIVIIGHSLGAAAAVEAANELSAAGVPVALVMPLDSVQTSTALGSTKTILNYYIGDGIGAVVNRGPGFRGRIENIDVRNLGAGHVTIDKSEKMQQILLNHILALGHRAPAPAGKPAMTSSGHQRVSAKGAAVH